MKQAVIGTYFETLKKAQYFVEKRTKLWRKKVDWIILGFSDGYIVISETQFNLIK